MADPVESSSWLQSASLDAWERVGASASTEEFDDSDLFGLSGVPEVGDIVQNVADCWIAHPLDAMSSRQQEYLKSAFEFDSATRRFFVTWEAAFTAPTADGRWVPMKVPVTQDDIQENIRRHGIGARDDRPDDADVPLWPHVWEAAAVNQLAREHRVTRDQAYEMLRDGRSHNTPVWGLSMAGAKYVTLVNFDQPGDSRSHFLVLRPGNGLNPQSDDLSTRVARIQQVITALQAAELSGDPVVLGTDKERPLPGSSTQLSDMPQDSLLDNHAFTVLHVEPDADGRDATVYLHNALGTNEVPEHIDPLEVRHDKDPYKEVKLSTLYDSRSITGDYGFHIAKLSQLHLQPAEHRWPSHYGMPQLPRTSDLNVIQPQPLPSFDKAP